MSTPPRPRPASRSKIRISNIGDGDGGGGGEKGPAASLGGFLGSLMGSMDHTHKVWPARQRSAGDLFDCWHLARIQQRLARRGGSRRTHVMGTMEEGENTKRNQASRPATTDQEHRAPLGGMLRKLSEVWCLQFPQDPRYDPRGKPGSPPPPGLQPRRRTNGGLAAAGPAVSEKDSVVEVEVVVSIVLIAVVWLEEVRAE